MRPFYVPRTGREHPDVIRAAPAVAASASVFGLSYFDAMSRRRTKPLPQARFAAMLALRRMHWSYPEIARAVGRDDHTTAIHGVNEALDLERTDLTFARAVLSAQKAMAATRPM